jgi:hypothetical protein
MKVLDSKLVAKPEQADDGLGQSGVFWGHWGNIGVDPFY